jgi:hypothetical protein
VGKKGSSRFFKGRLVGGKKRDVPFAGSHRILFFLQVGVFLIFLEALPV